MKKNGNHTLGMLRRLMWPHRGRLFVGLMLMIIGRLAGLVIPGLFKFLIDDVIIDRDVQLLTTVLTIGLTAVILQALSNFLLVWIVSVSAHRTIANLRRSLHKKVLGLSMKFFSSQHSATLAKRIMDDIDGIKNLLGSGMITFVGGILTALAAFCALLYLNTRLTLYTVLPIAIVALTSLKAYQYLRPVFRKRKKEEADVTGRLAESMAGIAVIKGYHAHEHEHKVFGDGVQRIYDLYKKSMLGQALATSGANLIMGLAAVAIMWMGSKAILNDEMEIGAFFSFILYLGFMISPLIQISNIGSLLTEAIAGLDRASELMKQQQESLQHNGPINSIEGSIQIEKLEFSYEDGQPILENIDLQVQAGSSLALVGSSGAGKSTLAALLAGFYPPSRGKILIDGIDLTARSLAEYRSQLGIVFQDDFLFDGTIAENIRFSNPQATEQELHNAVRLAHVNEFTDRFEKGLDTLIGERGIRLSGGQKQRISIARALLADPRILILDEATSNLDAQSEHYIQQSLKRLIAGRTTIIIAHRLSTIRNADQIAVMEQGSIIENGTHQSLMEKEGAYSKLVSLQARI